MVLKQLRKEKKLTQGRANDEFEEKHKIAINFGRIESNPNFKMVTFYRICDFFGITIEEFSKRVLSIREEEIEKFLNEKRDGKKSRKR